MSDSVIKSETAHLTGLYWHQMGQLKAAAISTRLHRARLTRFIRIIEVTKAIASSGSIAAWVVWQEPPFSYTWAGIIAAAQLLDAIKGTFPFSKEHRASNNLLVALELLLVESETEWQNISMGKISNDGIQEYYARLKRIQLQKERDYFPDGLDLEKSFQEKATKEARDYFRSRYSYAEPV